MDYDEEDNGFSGSIPEFGAIFMSNIETKKECFQRKVFALPSSKAEFVKHVKAGMILFLFEYKKRQLFGVYQASSDGAMDIVPHGFSYPGKRFPAQVCYTPIWHCDPLSENQFRDAIRDNYFSAKKFNFGLSRDQVRGLLYLFNSRKLINMMPPRPLSDAIAEGVGKDRRLLGDGRHELSERGCMEPVEYDEFNPAAFCDHQVNYFPRVNEDEVLLDDLVNTEVKTHLYSEEDFLAKRRRLCNNVAENGIYNHDTRQTFHIDDSRKDSLDEVRRLADGRKYTPVERVNENQGYKSLNRLEYLVDPLDVRANDDYRFMQRSRLFDEYNSRNGSGQAFASDRYAKSLDKIKHPIDDDMPLIGDSGQRDYNTHDNVKLVAYGDSNLNLRGQTRELIDDQECLMKRKLENRYHSDRDGSPISAFEHPVSLVHKIKKRTAAGRLQINESKSDFATCGSEGFSSGKFSSPLQCGHKIIHDRKYPIVEGRLNENMVDNNFCSTNLAKGAGCTGVDRRVVDDGRLRKSKKADNEEDKLPEKGFPLTALSHNFDPRRSTFDDATITRVVPYSPDHPYFSHGFSASITADQKSSLVQENHPHHGSLGVFYSQSKDRVPQHFLEPEKFSRPLDIAPEFGNNFFPTSIPGHRSSLLHGLTSSFVNSNLHVHMDLNTSVPINYRGSLFSKLSPPDTDLDNIGGVKRMFAYPAKSRENHLASDGDLPTTSQHVSQHVPLHEIDMLADKEFSCSEAKDFGVGIPHPEKYWASKNQYFRYSSNMNIKELHKIPEAPHANSNANRRSVFTRLTFKEEPKFDEEKDDIDFNNYDGYMDSTADEVMEMLQKSGNLSQRKLRKSSVGGQPIHVENEVKTQCHIETNHSAMEKNKMIDASLATADGTDELPKETRVVDFKRRSDRKILVRIPADPYPPNKITCANEEVKNPVKTTLKGRKLVRPDFRRTGSATDVCSNETSQIPAPILHKDDEQSCETIICIHEAEMPINATRISNVLASYRHQPMDCNNNEHLIPDEQKDIVAHEFQSKSVELNGHDTTNVELQIGSSQVLEEITHQKSSGFQVSAESILAKYINTTIPDLNVPGSYLEGFNLGVGCGNNHVEVKHLKTKKRKKKIKTHETNMGSSQ